MDQLPAEIVTQILSYLNVSDRKDASLVNHTWYEASRAPVLVQDLVFLIPKNGTPNVQKAAEAKNRHLVLQNIDARSDLVQNCKAIFSNLESLSVHGTDISEGMLILLLSHCQLLKSLDLSCCNSLFMTGMLLAKEEDIEKIKQRLHTLCHLNLSSIRYLSDSTFNRIILVAPNIENLSLAGCNIVFHTNVYSNNNTTACNNTAVLTFRNLAYYIHNHAENLQILDFGHTRINDAALKFLSETPNLQLKELGLVSCREVTDEGISDLCQGQVSLTRLDVSQCVDLSDTAIRAIATHLPHLRVLNLSKCRQITDAAVHNFSSMRHLKEVNFSSCYSLTAPGLTRSICPPDRLSALTHLNLSCCNAVNDAFVLELCKTVPNLLHLDISSCFTIQDTSVLHISQYLVRLRFLHIAWCREVSDYALLGITDPDKANKPKSDGHPIVRRQPSKIFGDLASLLPDRPPLELSEETVKSLKLHHANQAGSIYPISNLKYLKVLDLSSLPQISDASIKDAVKFNELQELSLGMCPGINDSALLAIGNNIPSLEVIDLSQCRRITDEGLIFLIMRLRRLRSLNISNCDGISDASIEALAAHAPHLKHLDVSMCGNISPQSVERVEHSMRHLTCVKKRLVGEPGYSGNSSV